eukprot:8547571-Lingulodinium_polyedra.AAC.1
MCAVRAPPTTEWTPPCEDGFAQQAWAKREVIHGARAKPRVARASAFSLGATPTPRRGGVGATMHPVVVG